MRTFTSGLSELSSRKGIWTLGKWGRVIIRPGCWTVGALVCAISVPPANAATTIVKLIFWLVGVREDFCFGSILIDLKTKGQAEIAEILQQFHVMATDCLLRLPFKAI